MSTIEWPDVFGYSIFCDDIRFEEGGKLSVIGVYQGSMFVHRDFPVSLPKLAILVRYNEKTGTQSHSLTLQLFLPGDHENTPSVVGHVPIEEMRKQLLPQADHDNTYGSLQANFILSPAVLKQPGVIRVRALCGDKILKMGSLKIEKAPQGQPSAPA